MAGEELGTGSSRDWAAKGTDLLGIRATIGQSYERIYRDNLLGMGASCPCSSKTARAGRNSASTGPRRSISAGSTTASNRTPELTVVAEDDAGETTEFDVTAQVGTPAAVKYVENGGVLHLVLRRLLTGREA